MQKDNSTIFSHNIKILSKTASDILGKAGIETRCFIVDKDNHKLYISEHLLGSAPLICDAGTPVNSSVQVLKSIDSSLKNSWVVFFKPTFELFELSAKKGLVPLQDKYQNNLKIENKIALYNNTPQHLKDLFPKSITGSASGMDFDTIGNSLGIPFFAQFSSGYSGKTTFLIKDEGDLSILKKSYGNLSLKASKLIKGQTLTVNGFLSKGLFTWSKPFFQVSGEQRLNPNPSGSSGNIFNIGAVDESIFHPFMQKVGQLLKMRNFSGFFGIDFIMEEKPYLIEINPRFTTSVSLQSEHRILTGKVPEFLLEMLSLMLSRIDTETQTIGLNKLMESEKYLLKSEEEPPIIQLIQYNTLASDYVSRKDLSAGTYIMENSSLFRISGNILFSGLKPGHFILFPPVKGRLISRGNEIARIICSSMDYSRDKMIEMLNSFAFS